MVINQNEPNVSQILQQGSTDLFFLVPPQMFLACKTEEFDFDMDGEKAPICFKEITTALRQWILPTFVSLPDILIQIPVVEEVDGFFSVLQ